jgi:hypothetical protein
MRLLFAIALLSFVAHAEPREQKLLSVAEDAFAHGFFGDALGAFREAYQLNHDSALLLKIGKCLEQLGYAGDAAVSYRQYLTEQKNLSEGERASMQAKISVLEMRAHPSPAPAAVVVAPAPPPPQPRPLVGLRRAVIASAIATAATLVVAGGLTFGAADAYSQLQSDCRQLSSGCNSGASDRLSALNHSADALWSIAAAGAIATVTLHLVLRYQKQR